MNFLKFLVLIANNISIYNHILTTLCANKHAIITLRFEMNSIVVLFATLGVACAIFLENTHRKVKETRYRSIYTFIGSMIRECETLGGMVLDPLVRTLENGFGLSDVTAGIVQVDESMSSVFSYKIKVSYFTTVNTAYFEHEFYVPRKHTGKYLSECGNIAKYTKVCFVECFGIVLRRRGILSPEGWHVFMGTDQNGDYEFTGSKGGSFIVEKNYPVVYTIAT